MFLETKCANGLHRCSGNNCNHSNKGIVQQLKQYESISTSYLTQMFFVAIDIDR